MMEANNVPIMNMIEERRCYVCGKTRHITEFAKRGIGRDKRCLICKARRVGNKHYYTTYEKLIFWYMDRWKRPIGLDEHLKTLTEDH